MVNTELTPTTELLALVRVTVPVTEVLVDGTMFAEKAVET